MTKIGQFNFEEFTANSGRVVPTINLSSSGFSLSAGFTKKYDFTKLVGVKMFYDKEKKAVGFAFRDRNEDGLLKVKLAPNKGGGSIKSKEFLIKYGINARQFQGKYEPQEFLQGLQKIFVIQLKVSDAWLKF